MTKSCIPGAFGTQQAHSYEPRYSEGAPALDTSKLPLMFPDDVVDALKVSKPRIYHGDVCTRCGDVVNVPPKD